MNIYYASIATITSIDPTIIAISVIVARQFRVSIASSIVICVGNASRQTLRIV